MPDDEKPKYMDIPTGYQSISLGFKHSSLAVPVTKGQLGINGTVVLTFRYIPRQLGWMKVEAWKLQVGFLS